jgi:hypothetical protein
MTSSETIASAPPWRSDSAVIVTFPFAALPSRAFKELRYKIHAVERQRGKFACRQAGLSERSERVIFP